VSIGRKNKKGKKGQEKKKEKEKKKMKIQGREGEEGGLSCFLGYLFDYCCNATTIFATWTTFLVLPVKPYY